VDRSAWSASDLDRARSVRTGDSLGIQPLFPAEADAFFRADRIRPGPTPLDQEFSVLLVVDGTATIGGDGWKVDLARGDVLLVPHSAGASQITGDADVLRCRAPDTSAQN
jgi:mannose-6-phosphate isomerase